MSTLTWSGGWLFHEVQNTVSSVRPLSANCSRSILASSYPGHIVVKLWHMCTNSRPSAGRFLVVYCTLAVGVALCRSATFTSIDNRRITFVCSPMSTYILGGVWSLDEVKLAVRIAFTSCFTQRLASFNLGFVADLIDSVSASSWSEVLFGHVVQFTICVGCA